jgi:hypothetical protein
MRVLEGDERQWKTTQHEKGRRNVGMGQYKTMRHKPPATSAPFGVDGLQLVVFMAAGGTGRTYTGIGGKALRLSRLPTCETGVEVLPWDVALAEEGVWLYTYTL